MLFQHSPSNSVETKLGSEMFDFWGGKSLSESVGNHFTGRVVDESNFAIFDNPANEVEAYVDVLQPCMVLVDLCECDCRLIVREQSSGVSKGTKDLADE